MALELITAIAIVLLGWAAVFFAAGGLGWLALRGLRAHEHGRDRMFLAFWLGLAAIALLAQAWNLMWPLDARFAALAGAGGLCGWFLSGGAARRSIRNAFGGAGAVAIAILVLVTLWCANRASGPPRHVDALIYHLGTVRWYAEHPIVRGLGNLHDRLALNNVSHLLEAALEGAGFAGRSFHLLNSALVVVILWRSILGASRLLRRDEPGSLVDAYWLLLLAPAVSVAVSSNMSSPTTDWPAMAVTFAAVGELLVLMLAPAAEERVRIGALAGALAFFTLSAACKLGHLPFAAFGSAAAVLAWTGGPTGWRRCVDARVAAVVAFCGATLGVWMYRNVLLTGYLIYPSIGRLDLPWTIPEQQRHLIESVVLANSRFTRHLATIHETPWIRGWLKWQLSSINFGYTVLPLAITAAGCLAALIWANRTRQNREWPSVVVVWACALPAIGVWALTDPMPRMGGFLFWSVAAATGALGWRAAINDGSRRFARLGIAAAVGLAAAPILGWYLLGAHLHQSRPDSSNLLVVRPGPDHGLSPAPSVVLEQFHTRAGLVVNTPVLDLGCADGPLPCTPFPSRHLALLDGQRIQSGFRIDPSLAKPPSAEEEGQIARFIALNAKPGDRLYADADAARWVSRALAAGELPASLVVVAQRDAGSDLTGMLADADSLLGKGRVWFVFSDGPLGPKADEMASMLYALDTLGVRGPHLHTPGISACAYDMLSPQ